MSHRSTASLPETPEGRARGRAGGTAQETPGEDPLVNGLYAEEFVSQLQAAPATGWDNAGAPPLKAAATLKHFLA